MIDGKYRLPVYRSYICIVIQEENAVNSVRYCVCVCMCGSCMNDLVFCILIFSCILYTINTFHMIDFYHDLFCLYILRRFILLMLLNRCSSFVNYINKYLSSDTLLKLNIFSSLLPIQFPSNL